MDEAKYAKHVQNHSCYRCQANTVAVGLGHLVSVHKPVCHVSSCIWEGLSCFAVDDISSTVSHYIAASLPQLWSVAACCVT